MLSRFVFARDETILIQWTMVKIIQILVSHKNTSQVLCPLTRFFITSDHRDWLISVSILHFLCPMILNNFAIRGRFSESTGKVPSRQNIRTARITGFYFVKVSICNSHRRQKVCTTQTRTLWDVILGIPPKRMLYWNLTTPGSSITSTSVAIMGSRDLARFEFEFRSDIPCCNSLQAGHYKQRVESV